MSSMIPSVILSSGFKLPIIGLGTWKSKAGEVQNAVFCAIESGYRHIDCAYIYGNEDEVAEGIHKAIDQGIVKREDLFITTKCWNTFHSFAKVLECCKSSLSKLKLDYIDLYLIHWPMGYQEGGETFPKNSNNDILYSDVDYLETWKGMEECVQQGLTRSIGLSNFNQHQIQRVLDNCKTQPAMLQVECHPYLNQSKLIEYCFSKNIQVTAYSPLGSPDRPVKRPDDPPLLEEPKLLAIAAEHNKSVAQVLIRFQVQRGVVVIPKSVTKERILQNFNVFDFELSEANMKVILNLDVNCRYISLDWIKDHPHHPFVEQAL